MSLQDEFGRCLADLAGVGRGFADLLGDLKLPDDALRQICLGTRDLAEALRIQVSRLPPAEAMKHKQTLEKIDRLLKRLDL